MNRLFKQICGKILFVSSKSCKKLSEVERSLRLIIIGSDGHKVCIRHNLVTVRWAVHPLVNDLIHGTGPSCRHVHGDVFSKNDNVGDRCLCFLLVLIEGIMTDPSFRSLLFSPSIGDCMELIGPNQRSFAFLSSIKVSQIECFLRV